ncbi:MAG: Fic family protein [Rhodomicrobium sp.]
MPITYLTLEDVVFLHARAVELSGDGPFAIRESGILDSVLQHIQNDDYYPTVEEKVTHLFHCLACFHCFVNGNKRAALAASALFLLNNGYIFRMATFLRAMENIVVHVADRRIDKPLLRDIITAHMCGNEDDEDLKLRVLIAISADEINQQ